MRYLVWDGTKEFEIESDEPLAPLSILAVDENMKSESAKGGPGSGHFGHGGREGKIGGSAPGKGSASFRPGEEREKRRAEGIYDVITETSEEYAKILLTQGVEPSFKPEIAELSEFAPGKGLEREGLYVANDEAFSKGSFGQVRLYMTADKGSLRAPQEMAQLGRTDLDDVLGTENGAVTRGRIAKDAFSRVEVYSGGKWHEMTPGEYLRSVGISGPVPSLPTVNDYGKWLGENAKKLYLRDNDVAELLHDYNRASLEDKIWMAQEAGLV